MSFGSRLRFESGSWLEAVYDVFIGIVVGARHSLFIGSRMGYKTLLQPIFQRLGYDLPIARKRFNDEGLKVVAVGYGRTGTVSFERKEKNLKIMIYQGYSHFFAMLQTTLVT